MCVRASRRWRSQEEEEEERKNPRITKESLRRICKEQKLYMTPHLNDVLYLHYKGYSKIENLEEYTGLRCLWLENNGIDKIENLDNQKDLRSLYLHNNLIKEIENLEGACPLLDSLNLCHNSVSTIKNLSGLEHLHTLHISHNRLQDFADVEHLKECKELSCVDLQHNWLDDPNIVDIFEAMPSLRVLYLTGNPVIKKIPFYRKNLTVRCKKLTYLDDRPVFPKDRAAAEAWSEGGLEAEQACRKKWADEERAKIDESVKGLLALRDRAKAAKFKAEMESLVPPQTGQKEEESEKDKEEEQDEDEEEEEEEDEEEEEAEAGELVSELEPPRENLEAGDSEEVAHNGIIFPWDLESDVRYRNRNELGEGGRSLIVELPDPNQTETKQTKSIARKGPVDPDIKKKLEDALVSAEGLPERNAEEESVKAEDLPGKSSEEEESVAAEGLPERNAEDLPGKSSEEEESVKADDLPEKRSEEGPVERKAKAAEEDVLPARPESSDVPAKPTVEKEVAQEEEEIEKGALDNLIKEKQLAYDKYVKKVQEEILPNISHFSFGKNQEEEEAKCLGKEIEELLKIEMEEMQKAKASSKEQQGEAKRKLVEEVERSSPRGAGGQDLGPMEGGQHPGGGDAGPPAGRAPKEVEGALGLFDQRKLIDEREASEVLERGAKVVEELLSIGEFPLRGKEAAESSSSDEEYQDPEEESLQAFAPAYLDTERSKLEAQDSEEYYSLVPEDEEVLQKEAEVFETPDEEPGAPQPEESDEREEGEGSAPEEPLRATYKRDIISSIELQIVTEKDEEEVEAQED